MASRGSSQWRLDEWGSPCEVDLVGIPIYPGGPRFQVNRIARPAFLLLGQKFLKHRYIVRRAGGYNCRLITGGTSASSHAYGISGDFNDDTNPYRRDRLVTDMPRAMVEDCYTIRNIDGLRVFRWGGDWDARPDTPNSNYDAMHWEIILTAAELERGFTHDGNVPISFEGSSEPVLSLPVLRIGARGSIVSRLQDLLQLKNRGGGDGDFGPRTRAALIAFQRSHGLEPDGICGHATWTALITHQPPLAVSAIGPRK